jgi:uncharacterized membrane protein YtjA (UPF0391 family)
LKKVSGQRRGADRSGVIARQENGETDAVGDAANVMQVAVVAEVRARLRKQPRSTSVPCMAADRAAGMLTVSKSASNRRAWTSAYGKAGCVSCESRLAPNPGPLRANYNGTRSPTVPEENIMLKWALVFAVIAVIAGLLGFTGIAAGAAVIAKFLFVLFLILCVVFLVLGFVVTKKIVD